MSKWVDADWIKDRNSFVPKHELHTVEEFMQILDEAPTADVVPITREVNVIHGEIDAKNGTITYHPTADVVEVVRCKDCKYSDTFAPDCTEATFPLKCLSIRYGGVYPDWFCEHGQRREDGGNADN